MELCLQMLLPCTQRSNVARVRSSHQNCSMQSFKFLKSFALKPKVKTVTEKLRFIRRLCFENLIIVIHWVSQREILLPQCYFSNDFLKKSSTFSLQTLTKFEAAKTERSVGFCVWPLWNFHVTDTLNHYWSVLLVYTGRRYIRYLGKRRRVRIRRKYFFGLRKKPIRRFRRKIRIKIRRKYRRIKRFGRRWRVRIRRRWCGLRRFGRKWYLRRKTKVDGN